MVRHPGWLSPPTMTRATLGPSVHFSPMSSCPVRASSISSGAVSKLRRSTGPSRGSTLRKWTTAGTCNSRGTLGQNLVRQVGGAPDNLPRFVPPRVGLRYEEVAEAAREHQPRWWVHLVFDTVPIPEPMMAAVFPVPPGPP